MKSPNGSIPKWLDWAFDQETDECLEFPFAKDKDGYGVWTQGSRPHRYICEKQNGPCPANEEARHSCNNRPCCNKRHLSWSTHLENIRDRHESEMTAKGTRHGRAKLTDDSVILIRQRIANGEKQKHLAAEFGVSTGLISNIKERKIWTHI